MRKIYILVGSGSAMQDALHLARDSGTTMIVQVTGRTVREGEPDNPPSVLFAQKKINLIGKAAFDLAVNNFFANDLEPKEETLKRVNPNYRQALYYPPPEYFGYNGLSASNLIRDVPRTTVFA